MVIHPLSSWRTRIEEGNWSAEEREELQRILDGNPSPPAERLRYWLTDCYVCGKVRVERVTGPRPETCGNCGAPIVVLRIAPRDEPA